MRTDIIYECARCGTFYKAVLYPAYEVNKRIMSRSLLEQQKLCPKCIASLDKWWEEKE